MNGPGFNVLKRMGDVSDKCQSFSLFSVCLNVNVAKMNLLASPCLSLCRTVYPHLKTSETT